MLIVSFFLFLLPHLAAALVIRLVDAVLALRGFIKSLMEASSAFKAYQETNANSYDGIERIKLWK